MKLIIIAAAAFMNLTQSATASNIWCGVVNAGIPGEYLNIRTGPGIEYSISEKIYPGNNVGVSTARCGLDAFDNTLCVGLSSDWVFLEQRFSGAAKAANATEYKGWVNGIYLSQTPCLP